QPTGRARIDPSIDVFGLIGTIVRRWVLVLGTAILVVVLALAALMAIGPRYEATSRILIDPREVRVVENELVQRGYGDNLLLVESQVEVIGSETVLGRVVERENLAQDPEFAQATSGAAERDAKDIALEN